MTRVESAIYPSLISRPAFRLTSVNSILAPILRYAGPKQTSSSSVHSNSGSLLLSGAMYIRATHRLQKESFMLAAYFQAKREKSLSLFRRRRRPLRTHQ